MKSMLAFGAVDWARSGSMVLRRNCS